MSLKTFFWKWRRRHNHTYWGKSLSIAGGSIVRTSEHAMSYLGVFGHSLNISAQLRGRAKGVSFGDEISDFGGAVKVQLLHLFHSIALQKIMQVPQKVMPQ